MIKKYGVLIGIVLSMAFLLVATSVYPGGSLADKNSVGFQWSKNFISNLFGEKAVNGLDNPSRIWAGISMMFLSISFALFFIRFSYKIPDKKAAKVVIFLGAGGMVFTFLISTPLHDLMVVIASTLFLLSFFYVTVFIYTSRLIFLKIFCTLGMLIFYLTLYLYGVGPYTYLPILQKITFASFILLTLWIEYYTSEQDFVRLK